MCGAMRDAPHPLPPGLPFAKMHGLGNDFVVFDARAEPLALTAQQVRAISDRHTGIGCDQLFVLEPSTRADVFMRIWNADGGEVAACGNGARCVSALLGGSPVIETLAGLLASEAGDAAASVEAVARDAARAIVEALGGRPDDAAIDAALGRRGGAA